MLVPIAVRRRDDQAAHRHAFNDLRV